jgi:hypothetical protein
MPASESNKASTTQPDAFTVGIIEVLSTEQADKQFRHTSRSSADETNAENKTVNYGRVVSDEGESKGRRRSKRSKLGQDDR